MKLTKKQIEVLDQIAMNRTVRVKDWRTIHALTDRELIKHPVTWKYPDPYYRLTDIGIEVWSSIVTKESNQ